MKQYVEAKIEGVWCIIDRMDITETATFTIYNDNGDPTNYPIDEHEIRVVKHAN